MDEKKTPAYPVSSILSLGLHDASVCFFFWQVRLFGPKDAVAVASHLLDESWLNHSMAMKSTRRVVKKSGSRIDGLQILCPMYRQHLATLMM